MLHRSVFSFIPQTALELNGVLNSCQKRSFFHHDLLFLLVPARVPVLVSLLLSSFFSRKGVLFHHDVLVPPGSGSGSGACLPSAFFLPFSGMISWFFLVPAGVPVLVSLLLSSFFSSERGSVPS